MQGNFIYLGVIFAVLYQATCIFANGWTPKNPSSCLEDHSGDTGWTVHNLTVSGCSFNGCTMSKVDCNLLVACDVISNEGALPNTTRATLIATLEDSGSPIVDSVVLDHDFPPGESTPFSYSLSIPPWIPSGRYNLSIQLTEESTKDLLVFLNGMFTAV